MYHCKYCGRYLKENYNNCPGCGANKFEKIKKHGTITINEVPNGGYKVNTKNIKKDNFAGIFLIIMGTIFICVGLPEIFFVLLSLYFFELVVIPVFFLFLIFPIVGAFLLYFGLKLTRRNKEKVRKIEQLAHTGVLIKNLTYTVKPTGTVINGNPIYCIEVIYENASGVKIPLVSEGKHDGRLSRGDGTVDLLIDPNDTSNYFIDFEIY